MKFYFFISLGLHRKFYLTLPKCRITEDVGVHGLPYISISRYLQHPFRSQSSSDCSLQAIQIFMRCLLLALSTEILPVRLNTGFLYDFLSFF